MGIASSDLTAVANFTVLNSVYIMVATMIVGRNKDWKGWLIVPYGVLLYQVIVILGANIRNPLSLYTGQDETDANTIFNIIFPILAFFFSIMGWAWCRVLNSSDLWPFGEKLPNCIPPAERTVVNVDEDGRLTIQADEVRPTKAAPLLKPTWSHLLITFLYFAIISAAQGIYDYIIITYPGDEWIAWLVNLGTGVVFSLLYLIYCVIWTDTFVFGYTKKQLKELDVDDATKKNIANDTRQRVIWTIVPIMAFHFIGNFAIGGTRLLSTDVDVNWLVMVGYFALLLLLLVIVYFVMRRMNPLASLKSKRARVNDGGNYYQDVASRTPLESTNVSKRIGGGNDLLGTHFLIEQ